MALFGFGEAKFTFTLKQQPLPATYVVTMLILTALFQIIPYLEELIRGLRNRSRQSPGPHCWRHGIHRVCDQRPAHNRAERCGPRTDRPRPDQCRQLEGNGQEL